MSVFFNFYVTCAFVLVIILLFLKYCRNTLKIYEGYPLLHILPYVIYSHFFGKVAKDIPLTSFALKVIIERCMEHIKAGICLTYITRPVLILFGEEPVKIFSNEKSAASKPYAIYHIVQDMLGPGLVTINGEKWKKHRKMINPAFGLGMLKEKVPLFNEHALALVKDLETLVGKPSSFEILNFIKCHYFNALSEAVFGLKQTEENSAEKLKYIRSLDKLGITTVLRTGIPWLPWKFLLPAFGYGPEFLHNYKEVFSFTKNLNVLLKRKQYITSNRTSDPDSLDRSLTKSFTYILFQHHLKDPSFTFEDLHGGISTFMGAGFDTISYATMWCLFMLGLHPEVQEKAFNEVQFSSKENYISYDDCSSFTYLESVILETLRLYPPIPLFARQLSDDIQCGERKIPKGTIIAFFPYVMHRNPDVYPEPENFDPERFLGNHNNSLWTYMPFAEGYRNCIESKGIKLDDDHCVGCGEEYNTTNKMDDWIQCIRCQKWSHESCTNYQDLCRKCGKKYALIEMKIFLAHFLRNFKATSLDRREDIELCWNIVLTPAKPLRMHIERR